MNDTMTISAWMHFWLETFVQPVAKPAGYAQYADLCTKHIAPAIGAYVLREVTPAMLQQFLNQQAATGNLRSGGPLSTKSIKNLRVVLDVMCKQAVAEGILSSNPVPLTVIRKCPKKHVDIMTNSDQAILEAFLFRDKNLQNIGILLSLYTGLRLGEVCALRWQCYDVKAKTLRVSHTVKRLQKEVQAPQTAKTALVFSPIKGSQESRTLPLPDIVCEILAFQRRRASELFGTIRKEDFIVYNTLGNITDPDNLSHYFPEVLEKLGLPHVKFHAIRHTFATRYMEQGNDVLSLSGLLGHASPATTQQYYLHPREESMRRGMQHLRPVAEIEWGLSLNNGLALS